MAKRAFSSIDFYRFHTANLREIEAAIRHVLRDLHRSIGSSHRRTVSAYTRLFALLLGTWAECRLQKLLYEPGSKAFTDQDRGVIRNAQSQYERWTFAIDLAFRKQYGIPNGPLQPPQLPSTVHYRYNAIIEALTTHLKPTIELRNKLAHGQWIYTLTNDELGISVTEMCAVRFENSLTLKLKQNLLSHLVDVIHDLVVSRPTFDRDFDDHFRGLESARIDLKRADYKVYEQQMRDRHRRGQLKSKVRRPDAETERKIRERAYHIYEARGRQDGDALSDWLRAKKEVLG